RAEKEAARKRSRDMEPLDGLAAAAACGSGLFGRLGARPAGVPRIGLGLAGALGDARRLAAPAAQIIELGAALLAPAPHLDRVDHRRMERKYALHTLPVGNLADREALVEAVPGAADAHALIGLHAAAVALDHLDVDDDGIARRKIGNLLAGRQFFDLLLLDLLNNVHGNSPSAAPIGRRAQVRSIRVCARVYDMWKRLSWGFRQKISRFGGRAQHRA